MKTDIEREDLEVTQSEHQSDNSESKKESPSSETSLQSRVGNKRVLDTIDDKKPFVELATDVKAKSTRKKMGLLGKALTNDDRKKDKEYKKKAKKNSSFERAPSRKAEYLFHATTYENLSTIITKGLDPSMGGSDVGASNTAEGKLKVDSLKGSSGYIHGATQSEVALHYGHKFDTRENKHSKDERKLADFGVMLRFKVLDESQWTEDTEDSRGNYKTQSMINPIDIEYLDPLEGWSPISSIKNLVDIISVPEVKVPLDKESEDKSSFFLNLTIIDLSSSGASLDKKMITALIECIKRGELPNLRELVLTKKQISETQVEDLKNTKPQLNIETI